VVDVVLDECDDADEDDLSDEADDVAGGSLADVAEAAVAVPDLDLLEEDFGLADLAVGSFGVAGRELLLNPHFDAFLVHVAHRPTALTGNDELHLLGFFAVVEGRRVGLLFLEADAAGEWPGVAAGETGGVVADFYLVVEGAGRAVDVFLDDGGNLIHRLALGWNIQNRNCDYFILSHLNHQPGLKFRNCTELSRQVGGWGWGRSGRKRKEIEGRQM
jgi:hypothetical protein